MAARHPGAPEDLHAPRAGVHRGPCGADGTCLVGRTGATYVVAREEAEHNDTHAGRQRIEWSCVQKRTAMPAACANVLVRRLMATAGWVFTEGVGVAGRTGV